MTTASLKSIRDPLNPTSTPIDVGLFNTQLHGRTINADHSLGVTCLISAFINYNR